MAENLQALWDSAKRAAPLKEEEEEDLQALWDSAKRQQIPPVSEKEAVRTIYEQGATSTTPAYLEPAMRKEFPKAAEVIDVWNKTQEEVRNKKYTQEVRSVSEGKNNLLGFAQFLQGVAYSD